MPLSVSHGWLRFVQQAVGSGADHAMPRLVIWAVAGVLLLLCHSALAAGWDTASNEQPAFFDWRTDYRAHAAILPGLRPVRPLDTGFALAPPWVGSPELSAAELRVSEIASRYGDRNYVMVDKNRGKIFLFTNGRPTYVRPALTGESMADRIPADAYRTPWSKQQSVKFKVTPAGRFTMTRDRDPALGDLFDVNELQGRDWTIAIHRVSLGRPAERRDARLRSDTVDDKHITNGCIDVDPSTMAQLLRLLPGRGMPLYILPNDETLISEIFPGPVRRPGPGS